MHLRLVNDKSYAMPCEDIRTLETFSHFAVLKSHI